MEGYEDFKEPPVGDLSSLSRLADELAECERHVAQLESQVENARKRMADLAERQIPEMMDDLCLETFTTTNGFRVDVKKTVRASVPAHRRNEAMDWLDANGHGGLVKRNISVAFTREQQDDATRLQSELAESFENVRAERKVEPSTLSAFIREQLKQGAEIPMDLFGAWEQRIARISRTE